MPRAAPASPPKHALNKTVPALSTSCDQTRALSNQTRALSNQARTLSINQVPLRALLRWLLDERVPHQLKQLRDYVGYGVFTVHSLDVSGVQINFEIFGGEFNVNGFVRLLAEGEVKAKLGAAAAG